MAWADRWAGRTAFAPAFAALWLALCWPAALGGGALWFSDIGPYVKGGHVAVRTVLDAPSSPVPAAPAEPPGGVGGVGGDPGAGMGLAPAQEVSGARSVAYSVVAYLGGLPLPGFWALVLFQTGVLAWLGATLIVALRLTLAEGLAAGTILVVGTSAPFSAGTAMPDVWAGILILSFVLLDAHRGRLSVPALVVAGGAAAFAVAAHASHVALAGGLVVASVLATLLRGRGRRWTRLAVPVAVVTAGIGATVAAGVIGFGEASVAPKRYPIVLARAVEDGPALWHLEEHCDEYGYAICEVFPGEIPRGVGDFLWNEGGVRDLATPEQMDRVRAEEALIVRRAMAEYPFAQARRALGNVARQLSTFGVTRARLGVSPRYEGDGEVSRQGTRRAGPLRALTVLHYAVFLVAVGLAAFAVLRRRGALGVPGLRALWLTGAGVTGNAVICGVLSIPAERYQSRVAWTVPLVVMVVVLPALRRARHPTP